MIVIIDGYNVLRSTVKGEATVQEKKAFVVALKRYAHATKHHLIVVFDGGSTAYPDKETVQGVEIVHVGYKQSADEYITALFDHERGRDVVVASSDRALCRNAHQKSIETIDADAFYSLVMQKPERRVLQKRGMQMISSGTDNQDLAAVLEQESRKIPVKHDEQSRQRTSAPLSKEERRLMRKLKKLIP